MPSLSIIVLLLSFLLLNIPSSSHQQELFLQTLDVKISSSTTSTTKSSSFGNETLHISSTVDSLIFGDDSNTNHQNLRIFKGTENSVIVSSREASATNFVQPGSNEVKSIFMNRSSYSSTSNKESWVLLLSSSAVELNLKSPPPVSSSSSSSNHRIKVSFLQQATETYYNAFENKVIFDSNNATQFQHYCIDQSNRYKCCTSSSQQESTSAYFLDYNFSNPIRCMTHVMTSQQDSTSNANLSMQFDLDIDVGSDESRRKFSKNLRAQDNTNLSSIFAFVNAEANTTVSVSIIDDQVSSSTAITLMETLKNLITNKQDHRFCFYPLVALDNDQYHLSFTAPSSTTFGNTRNKLGYFADTFAQQDKQCHEPGFVYTSIYDSPPSSVVSPYDQLAAIKDRYLVGQNLFQLSGGTLCEIVEYDDENENGNTLVSSVSFECSQQKKNIQLQVSADFQLGHENLKRLFPVNVVADGRIFIERMMNDEDLLNFTFCFDITNLAGVTSPAGTLLFSIKSLSCGNNNDCSNISISHTRVTHRPSIPVFTTRQFCVTNATLMMSSANKNNHLTGTARLEIDDLLGKVKITTPPMRWNFTSKQEIMNNASPNRSTLRNCSSLFGFESTTTSSLCTTPQLVPDRRHLYPISLGDDRLTNTTPSFDSDGANLRLNNATLSSCEYVHQHQKLFSSSSSCSFRFIASLPTSPLSPTNANCLTPFPDEKYLNPAKFLMHHNASLIQQVFRDYEEMDDELKQRNVNQTRLNELRIAYLLSIENERAAKQQHRKRLHDAAAFFLSMICIITAFLILFFMVSKHEKLQEILNLKDFFEKFNLVNSDDSSEETASDDDKESRHHSPFRATMFNYSPSPTRSDVPHPVPMANHKQSPSRSPYRCSTSFTERIKQNLSSCWNKTAESCAVFANWMKEKWTEMKIRFCSPHDDEDPKRDVDQKKSKKRTRSDSKRPSSKRNPSSQRHISKRMNVLPPHPLFDVDGISSAETDLEFMEPIRQQQTSSKHIERSSSSIRASTHVEKHHDRHNHSHYTKGSTTTRQSSIGSISRISQVPSQNHRRQQSQQAHQHQQKHHETSDDRNSIAAWSDFAPELMRSSSSSRGADRRTISTNRRGSASSATSSMFIVQQHQQEKQQMLSSTSSGHRRSLSSSVSLQQQNDLNLNFQNQLLCMYEDELTELQNTHQNQNTKAKRRRASSSSSSAAGSNNVKTHCRRSSSSSSSTFPHHHQHHSHGSSSDEMHDDFSVG